MIEWKKVENTALVTMTNHKNTMDLSFAKRMLKTFDDILADQSVNAMVLTSNDPKFFSMGVNVEWFEARINEKDFDAAKQFLFTMHDVFKKILLMPVPVIAAINGHAFGNGSIISCACDFRFMRADRGYFAFPEVDLDIPFLPSMFLWLERAIPHGLFKRMVLTGNPVTAPELEAHSVIEKACKDSDELLEDALAFAAGFNKKRPIFGELKRRMNQHIITAMETQDNPILEKLAIFVK